MSASVKVGTDHHKTGRIRYKPIAAIANNSGKSCGYGRKLVMGGGTLEGFDKTVS